MRTIDPTRRTPSQAALDRLIARDDLARAEGRKPRSDDGLGTPALRSKCGGCELSLSAFPSRRAFADHRAGCEASS